MTTSQCIAWATILKKSLPPRKKAILRRSNEANAIARDLAGDETNPDPTSEEKQAQKSDTESLTDRATSDSLTYPTRIFCSGGRRFYLPYWASESSSPSVDAIETPFIRCKNVLETASNQLCRKKRTRAISWEQFPPRLRGYTSAATIEEKLPFVRQPERVEPLMRKYYQTHALVPEEGAELLSQFPLPLESSSFVVLTASFTDGPNRIFLAEATTDLKIAIDWESDVCYQPVEIADYIAEKPTDPVDLRVFAQPDNFYVFEFSDSEKYQCLKLTFRDNDEFLFGYVERNTPVNERLKSHFQKVRQAGSTQAEPLFLKVRFLEDSKAERGVLIEEFISARWANIDESNDYE